MNIGPRVSSLMPPPPPPPTLWELQGQMMALQQQIAEAHQVYTVTRDMKMLDLQQQLSRQLDRVLQQMHRRAQQPSFRN